MSIIRNFIIVCIILAVIGLLISIFSTEIIPYTIGFTIAACSIIAIIVTIGEGIIKGTSGQ